MAAPCTIRLAAASEAARLSELAERTFRDTFASFNRADDVDLHCRRSFGPAIQSAEILDPDVVTLVAGDDASLVAYAQLRLAEPVPAELPVCRAAELRRLYVDRRWQGAGVAGALMDAAIARAGQRGFAAVWLGVWERNDRALRFYRRRGFVDAGEHAFVLGDDVQRDLVMWRAVANQ